MMRAHEVDATGLIVNTVMVEQLSDGQVDADLVGGSIGDRIVNGQLFRREPDVVVLPTFASLKAAYLIEVRSDRERILSRLNGYAGTLLLKEPPENAEEKALCIEIIQGLLDITTIEPVASATTFAQLKAAVKAEYARLVGMASVDMVKAFRSIDI